MIRNSLNSSFTKMKPCINDDKKLIQIDVCIIITRISYLDIQANWDVIPFKSNRNIFFIFLTLIPMRREVW